MLSDPEKAKVDEMRRVNEAQKSHYNAIGKVGWSNDGNSWATNLWSKLRHRAMQGVSQQARDEVYVVQKDWMGNLSDKKVLDLGAGAGSFLSKYLADNAREYHAIELSGTQLTRLGKKIGPSTSVRLIEDDFLNPIATDNDYDIIYAHAVLHHFRHLDELLVLMDEKLAENGKIVSYDPSQVWLPMYLFRMLYRPFQTDAEWEFPFSRRTMKNIESRFSVLDRLGVFRRGKWALILGMFSPTLGRKFGDSLFLRDFTKDRKSKGFGASLHVSYYLEKKR